MAFLWSNGIFWRLFSRTLYLSNFLIDSTRGSIDPLFVAEYRVENTLYLGKFFKLALLHTFLTFLTGSLPKDVLETVFHCCNCYSNKSLLLNFAIWNLIKAFLFLSSNSSWPSLNMMCSLNLFFFSCLSTQLLVLGSNLAFLTIAPARSLPAWSKLDSDMFLHFVFYSSKFLLRRSSSFLKFSKSLLISCRRSTSRVRRRSMIFLVPFENAFALRLSAMMKFRL